MPSAALDFAEHQIEQFQKQKAELGSRIRKAHRRVAGLRQELARVDEKRARKLARLNKKHADVQERLEVEEHSIVNLEGLQKEVAKASEDALRNNFNPHPSNVRATLATLSPPQTDATDAIPMDDVGLDSTDVVEQEIHGTRKPSTRSGAASTAPHEDQDPRSRVRMLQSRKICNLHIDVDNNLYAVCCDVCGANSHRGRQDKYATFTVSGIRAHLREAHGQKGLELQHVIERCKGSIITDEYQLSILAGEPTDVDERVLCKSIPHKRRRHRARQVTPASDSADSGSRGSSSPASPIQERSPEDHYSDAVKEEGGDHAALREQLLEHIRVTPAQMSGAEQTPDPHSHNSASSPKRRRLTSAPYDEQASAQHEETD